MLNLLPENKIAGIFVPLFALRGTADLGVGDTQALRELVDWCAEVGLSVAQILPINETGSDHSPYHTLSSVAIEPSTITTTPDFLPDLSPKDFVSVTSTYPLSELRTSNEVQYKEVKALKLELLEAAFNNLSSPTRIQDFQNFCKQHAEWLEPYALFRSLVHIHGQSEFSEHWPAEQHDFISAKKWAAQLEGETRSFLKYLQKFYSYIQWIAFSQWQELKEYAESRNVALMGDIPVGISLYSADVWSSPHLFSLDRFCGAPPEKNFEADCFTKKWGQNWGFPLYNWAAMHGEDNYHWWRRRLRLLRSIFHLLRIDHVLGFYRIYTFPWRPSENTRFLSLEKEEARRLTGGILPQFMEQDDSTEENRQKNQLQGETLLRMFLEETGPYRLIAEDLGEVPPYARPSLQALKIPGIKIPFWERNEEGKLIPGTQYHRLSLATYTTHDHPPLKALWEKWEEEAKSGDPYMQQVALSSMQRLLEFANRPSLPLPQPFTEEIHFALLQALFASNSWLVVPPITDFFGTNQQFNTPGSPPEQNWRKRLEMPINQFITKKKTLISHIQGLLYTTCRKNFET